MQQLEVPEYRLNCLFSVPFNSNSENPNSIARAHPYIERCMQMIYGVLRGQRKGSISKNPEYVNVVSRIQIII
jgi:hypothetical protein